jgi:chaperonin GroES
METSKPNLDIRKLKTSNNITEMLDDDYLENLGARVVQDYESDDRTRTGWKKRNEEAMKLALQVTEVKSYPWANASNVKFPLLSQAALQFQVRAYGQLAKGPDIVKNRVRGHDPDGQKAARASRVSQHMSYQLLDEDDTWEDGFDKLLMVLPIMGLCYRKKFWDVEEQRLKTTTVLPQDLVVPYRAKTLETVPRKTEIFELYDREIKESQNLGSFRKVDLGRAESIEEDEGDKREGITSDISDDDRPRQMLEQHLFLDLDGDDYKEPYIVTVDKSSSKVLRVVQRFGDIVSKQSLEADKLKDEITGVRRQAQEFMGQMQQQMQQMQQAKQEVPPETMQAAQQKAQEFEQQIESLEEQVKELEAQKPDVLKIPPIECYTKYSFIPAPDGSFYDIGFGSLIGPLNRSVNSLMNQLIDSGSLQNGSQGFLGRGARIKGGKVRFEPYEWKTVNSTGQTLRESIVPLPVNAPSPVLFNLLGLLIEYTQQLSSVTDAMSGKDMGQNTPAYNMQAMLQQGMQVFNGIFKRVYRSMRQEFREQYRLNAVYMNPEEYFSTIDGPVNVMASDYSGDPKDIYPAADPNAFSSQEKAMKAQFLSERSQQVPGYDNVNVEKRLLESMDIEDRQEVFPLDEQGQMAIPPPPNKELELEVADMQRKVEESRISSENETKATESTAVLNELKGMEIMAKIRDSGDQTAIKAAEATTKRLKVANDARKDQRDSTAKEAANEDSRGTSK